MLKRWMIAFGCVVAVGFADIGGVRAQSADPETRAVARELMVVMRASDQMKAVMPAIIQALKPVIVQGRAEVERDYDRVAQQALEALLSRLDGFLEAMSIVYARHFTAAELRDLIVFMRGTTGQKFVEKTPTIMNEGVMVGQKFGEQVAIEMRAKMIDDLRKLGHKI